MAHLVTPGHNLRDWIGGWGPYALHPTYPSGGLGTSSPDLFVMLQKHASKLASDPRDKIYALVGISIQRSTFPIDYSSSVRDVYMDLARTVITESQSLDIIYVVKKIEPLNEHGLPSWVPDWSGQAYLEQSFADEYMQWYPVAAGSTRAKISSMEGGTIIVKGYIVDIIQSVGDSCRMDFPTDLYDLLEAFRSWWAMWKSLNGSSDAAQESFVRTLFCNQVKNSDGGVQPFRWILEILCKLSLERHPKVLLDATLQALLEDSEYNHTPALTPAKMTWVTTVARNIIHRRFFVSSSGRPGLALNATDVGDKICILFGCRVPVILRPIDGHYVILGPAYVDGLMYGAAMDIDLEEEEFEIH